MKSFDNCVSIIWERRVADRSCVRRILSVVIVFLAFMSINTLNAHDITYDENEMCFMLALDSNDNELWTFDDFGNMPEGVRMVTRCIPRGHFPFSYRHQHSHPTTPGGTLATSSGSKTRAAQARQIPQTCSELPPSIRVTSPGVGAQCQRVAGASIGNDEIVKAGPLEAVDVWGFVQQGTQVCFDVAGASFKFIDTAPIPRVVYDLPAYSDNRMLCATINGPGIVVLLPGPPPPVGVASIASRSLSNCMATTTAMLNFRAGPGGEVIGGVPYNASLTALERTAGWFKVDYYGTKGWISADYVVPQGNCG